MGAIDRHPRRPGRLRSGVIASTVSVLTISATLALPAQAQSPGATPDGAAPIPTARPIGEACEPAAIPFDPDDIQLTGRWSADDKGIYYIRQVGDKIFWNGMSDRIQRNGELGRDWDNVAFGTLFNDRITLDWADIPYSPSQGTGKLSLQVRANADGNLEIHALNHEGFGGENWTPCLPETTVFDSFVRPFSMQPRFGEAVGLFDVAPELAFVGTEGSDGMSAWVIGPGWTSTCSVTTPSTAPVGVDGVLAYLRTLPDITVGQPVATTVGGRDAVSVDLESASTLTGCRGEWVNLWTVSDFGAGMGGDGKTRLVALDVDDATVVFEIWGDHPDTWRPRAQALLDSVKWGVVPNLGETVGAAADDGARIVRVEALDERTRDLTIESPSVGYAKVRLLLPTAFDAKGSERWPVLYLLQGCCDDYTSWTRETDVKALTEPTDLIVAMPAAGGNGWYSDWWNQGTGGVPMWETFHTQELPQLLERNFAASDDRVIAGLSMGGYGALSYAARHPGMYQAAASFSGVPNILGPDFDTGTDPVWGDKITQADNWEAHDVVSQAATLKGIPLYIAYGNGVAGPLDIQSQSVDTQEKWIGANNDTLVARLKELGIPATVNAYGPGTHTWPYWERELHNALPMLLEAIGD